MKGELKLGRPYRYREGELHLFLGGMFAQRPETGDEAFAHYSLSGTYRGTTVHLRSSRYVMSMTLHAYR